MFEGFTFDPPTPTVEVDLSAINLFNGRIGSLCSEIEGLLERTDVAQDASALLDEQYLIDVLRAGLGWFPLLTHPPPPGEPGAQERDYQSSALFLRQSPLYLLSFSAVKNKTRALALGMEEGSCRITVHCILSLTKHFQQTNNQSIDKQQYLHTIAGQRIRSMHFDNTF
jgi:hypothetical protein